MPLLGALRLSASCGMHINGCTWTVSIATAADTTGTLPNVHHTSVSYLPISKSQTKITSPMVVSARTHCLCIHSDNKTGLRIDWSHTHLVFLHRAPSAGAW